MPRGTKPIYPGGVMQRIQHHLPQSYIDALDRAAQKRHMSRSKLVRKILHRFLLEESKHEEVTGAV